VLASAAITPPEIRAAPRFQLREIRPSVLPVKQQPAGLSVSIYMEPDDLAGSAALRWPEPEPPDRTGAGTGAEAAVDALYRAQAGGLIRLAYLMLGDRAAAEDVVQDAFCGLYRRWDRLADPGGALAYVRSSVLNGCRTALRRRARGRQVTTYQPSARSAEAAALSREERQEVMRAVRALPDRQREALVLRFYLDLSDPEIARMMGIRPGTVRSATHRALKALGRMLEGTS
jgi:RNA polymerase sigma-70 factor (sigma-E family)